MFLSYLNYQLNAYPGAAPRKAANIIDLKNVYRSLTSHAFPHVHKNVSIESVELCSNSKGCNPKKNGGKLDYLLAMKNSAKNIKTGTFNKEDNAVLLNVRGKYKINNVKCELYLRIPKSAAVGVRLGMSEQKHIKIDGNGDARIETLRKEITTQLYEVLGIVPHLRPTKINGMAVHGLNLHNPLTGNRPPQKIKNFLQILRLLDTHLKSHSLDYDKKNGKQVARGNFKPDIHGSGPTIGITGWTMVDFVGGRSVMQVVELKNELMQAFNLVQNNIIYTTNAKQPKAHGKANTMPKGCPKNVPTANASGNCPSDIYIPLPNKHNSLCCYKKKLTKSSVQDIIKKYNEAKMKIPESLQYRINTLGVVPKKVLSPSSVKLVKSEVYYNKKQKDYFYKNKKFNCMSLPKPQVENIAILMKLNPKGFKKDLCLKIHKKAQNDANNKYKRARLRLLKMKAKLSNMKSG